MNNPGQMNQVVTLSQPQQTADKFGQHTAWVVVADVAARFKPLTGREFFAAGAMQSPADAEIEIYYRADVQANWRVSWMGRVFEIAAAPIDVEAMHELLLLMLRAAPI